MNVLCATVLSATARGRGGNCKAWRVSCFADLAGCARHHLEHYLDPAGPRAFTVYDGDWAPDEFRPTDALAPGLLDAPVKGSIVVKLFASDASPYTALRIAMQRLLDETTATDPLFADVDLADDDGPWSLMRSVLRLSDETPGLAASMVTKMLHSKRPQFVPIFDSKVAEFYGTTQRTPWNLWPRLQADLRRSPSRLGAPDHRLRRLEVICEGASRS